MADMLFYYNAAILPSILSSKDNNGSNVNTTLSFRGEIYKTILSPYTGRIWLDRNLGASQVCTELSDIACYGDYYQWGRDADGHQLSTSYTTSIKAADINNAGSQFITTSSFSESWTTVDATGYLRKYNWSKTDGSSVCPIGYRVPTDIEMETETIKNGVNNNMDAFNNFLRLPSAGYRHYTYGGLLSQGVEAYFWTNGISNGYYTGMSFRYDSAGGGVASDVNGKSFRCIK